MQPTTYKSKTGYTLTQDADRLAVTQDQPQKVVQAMIANGEAIHQISSYKSVFRSDPMPIVIAYPVRNSTNWDIDTDAGVMRWTGQQTRNQVYAAFRRLGFASHDYLKACRDARKADQ